MSAPAQVTEAELSHDRANWLRVAKERDEIKTERDQLRAEVEAQCLLNGKGAEREADLRGRLERAEREVERLKANGAASAFIAMSCRASRAETDRNNLRADLDAIKAILNEEKGRAERAEASLKEYFTRAEKAEAELAGIRALADRRNKRDHSQDTTHQLVAALDQALDIAQAELKAERARLDWLSTRGFEHRHHETGDHLGYEWTISSYSESEDVTLRDVIDAEMQEEAK